MISQDTEVKSAFRSVPRSTTPPGGETMNHNSPPSTPPSSSSASSQTKMTNFSIAAIMHQHSKLIQQQSEQQLQAVRAAAAAAAALKAAQQAAQVAQQHQQGIPELKRQKISQGSPRMSGRMKTNQY